MSTPEKEKYLEKLSVQFRGAQVLAQGKYHTWVRRDGEGRRHDGEEKVRVNGCSRSFCVCTRTVCRNPGIDSFQRKERKEKREEGVSAGMEQLLSSALQPSVSPSVEFRQSLAGLVRLSTTPLQVL